jgi:ATP-dependent RNA helicase DHX57
MSATVDTTLFLRYFEKNTDFDPCVVSIPGFTFHVEEHYLEDVLDLTGYKIGRNSRYAMRKKVSSSPDLPSIESAPATTEDMDNWESLADDRGREDILATDAYSEATIQSLSIVDQTLINYELIEIVICAILEDAFHSRDTEGQRGTQAGESRQSGAVLVFLPGVAEIRRLQKQLTQSSQIAACDSGGLRILALHGSLSSDEQRRVFSRPAPGVRKIVLATNIAETSVTIDDVV